HVYYVPLIPLGTYLVFDGTEREEPTAWWRSSRRTSVSAIPLPFSIKPLLWAWLRLICSLAAIGGIASGTAAFATLLLTGVPAVLSIAAGLVVALLGFRLLGTLRFHYLAFALLGLGIGVALSCGADALHLHTWHSLGAIGILGFYLLESTSYASR